ncbi:hypothetical protein F2P79_009526 [Pimephales promelas]|nr:hypothetical protein F2P79_009526 [Pimephales promelas]
MPTESECCIEMEQSKARGPMKAQVEDLRKQLKAKSRIIHSLKEEIKTPLFQNAQKKNEILKMQNKMQIIGRDVTIRFKPIAWLALLRSLVVRLPEFPLAAFFCKGLILLQMLYNKGIRSFSASRTEIASDYAFIFPPKRADYSQKY